MECSILNKHCLFSALTLSLFAASNLDAQKMPDPQELKSRYPEENALTINHSKNYTLELKSNNLLLSSETDEMSIALNETGITYINSAILYSNSMVRNKIVKAATYSINKAGKYQEYKATDIVERDDRDDYIFYDDSKATQITFQSVSEGSVTVYKSEQTYTEPRLLGSFSFGSSIRTLNSEITIRADKRIQLNFVPVNCEEIKPEYSSYEKGGFRYYTWKATNLKSFHRPPLAPDARYFIPHLLFGIKGYLIGKDTIPVLKSFKDLYKWYSSEIKNVNVKPAVVLSVFTDSLVKGCANELDKVKKIFYWVQDNIKYIAFEDGSGGQVPREASAIYEKRYGDCKDMASIITKMLSAANIKSYITWIGTRSIPYRYEEIVGPVLNNHMIAMYKDQSGKMWPLDATGKNAALDIYTSMIQGKQALIGIDEKQCELYTIPIIPKENNLTCDSLNLYMSNDSLCGTGTMLLNGHPKIDLDYLTAYLTEKDLKEAVKAEVQKGNNSFSLDMYELKNKTERELPTVLTYSCHIANYLKSFKDEVYINLNLDKSELSYQIEDSRNDIPLEFDNTVSLRQKVLLRIPKDRTLGSAPENQSFQGNGFGFSIQYTANGNSITMDKYFYCDKLLIKKEDFPEWKQMISQLTKAFNETATLTRKKK